MASSATVRIAVEVDGLGPGVIDLAKKFADTELPDDYRRFDTMLSTTAILLSTIVNVTCSELKGLMLLPRDGIVYVNTISTNISTAGQSIPDGCPIFMHFEDANSCVVALKGNDADTAVSGIFYSQIT